MTGEKTGGTAGIDMSHKKTVLVIEKTLKIQEKITTKEKKKKEKRNNHWDVFLESDIEGCNVIPTFLPYK